MPDNKDWDRSLNFKENLKNFGIVHRCNDKITESTKKADKKECTTDKIEIEEEVQSPHTNRLFKWRINFYRSTSPPSKITKLI